jgi:hypothetical protein
VHQLVYGVHWAIGSSQVLQILSRASIRYEIHQREGTLTAIQYSTARAPTTSS